jgi:MoaA/NifB/PqqE/SkfB family radical SAM enzyme
MLNPATILRASQQIRSRKLNAVALAVLRRMGRRYLVVRMDTTNLCNLRCRMCYYSLEHNRKKEEMDLPLFRSIASRLFPRTRFLYLSCQTEPLVNRNFAEILRVAGQYRVPFTSFCTNGQLLKKEVIEACIESKISEVIVSVDGANPETYEYIRRGGKWDKLVENLDLLASMKRQAGTSLPRMRINFTSMQRNIQELPAVVRFAAEHDVRSIQVRHLLLFIDEENSYQEQMAYTNVFNSVAKEAGKEAKARGVDLFLPEIIPDKAPLAAKTRLTHSSRLENNPHCLLPWYQIAIRWDGDCSVCPQHQGLGNLSHEDLAVILNGPKLREIRHKMFWRSPDACSWTCRDSAHAAPESAKAEQSRYAPENVSLVHQGNAPGSAGGAAEG